MHTYIPTYIYIHIHVYIYIYIYIMHICIHVVVTEVRQFPMIKFHGNACATCGNIWQNVARYGNMCALKQTYGKT